MAGIFLENLAILNFEVQTWYSMLNKIEKILETLSFTHQDQFLPIISIRSPGRKPYTGFRKKLISTQKHKIWFQTSRSDVHDVSAVKQKGWCK